jgi:hypothetical protein
MGAATGLSSAIETKPVWESAAVAIVTGVGVIAFFSLGLLAVIRYAELRRQERPMLSGLFGLVGLLALALAAGTVVYGLVVVA